MMINQSQLFTYMASEQFHSPTEQKQEKDIQLESTRDKSQQFIAIIDLTIKITLAGSIVMGPIHYFSDAKGSAIQRSCYPFFLLIFCVIQKVIYLSSDNNYSILTKVVKPFIQRYRTTFFLMAFTIAITEVMIFESESKYIFSPS